MSFNVGKKESVKEVLTAQGYTYITPSEFAKNHDKIMVEVVRVLEGVDENTGETSRYGVIAGSALKDNAFSGKVWFYIPAVDNADIVSHSSEEDRNLIEAGNYIYTIEIKTSKKGRDYCVGTLLKG
ncbi:MAG: hypothetical protein II013_04485 [Lachnobacterium sp.]|nr:hypothetical protein [Lachnobacterium sp.]